MAAISVYLPLYRYGLFIDRSMSPHAISYTSNVPSVCAGQHSLDCWPALPNESQTNEGLTMCHRVAFFSGCDAADTAAGFPALFRRCDGRMSRYHIRMVCSEDPTERLLMKKQKSITRSLADS